MSYVKPSKYLIFDLETQINKSHKRVANPWHPDNYVVMRGWKKQGDACASWKRFEQAQPDNHLMIDADVSVLVGHNIKFDMLYEMAGLNPHLREFFQRGGRIWDTQYAEYLIRAQERSSHMCSMDSIAESYGGRVKIDQIKAMWAAGIQTSEIDPDLLADYLVGSEDEGRNSGDIGNTEKIYLGQIKAAKELGMYRGVLHRMEGLAGTTEMEFNGIKVDGVRAQANLKVLQAKRDAVALDLEQYVKTIPEEVGFSWGSRVHTSCLIYGGTIRYVKRDTYLDEATGELARLKATEDWPLFDGVPIEPCGAQLSKHEDGLWYMDDEVTSQDKYLSGKKAGSGKFKKVAVQGELKTKLQDFFYELPQVTKPEPEWKTKNTDGAGAPLFGTGSDIIAKLSKRGIPFLEAMGNLQALDKEIGTYYIRYDEKKKEHVGMLTCVMDDGIVHHSLNHSSTVTTRLSANNPNAQNFPRGDKSELKAIFVSRFGDAGEMIEADYSQLEVVVQGLLSGDVNLCKDLIARVDFHCKRVALKNSVSYDFALLHCKNEDAPDYAKWKKERTKCKIFSFQRAYGAGPGLIAEETGMDIEEVKDMIVKEDAEYPGVVKFNADVEAAVLATAEPFRAGADEGYRVFRKGFWQAPTGTMYGWRSYDAPSYLRRQGIADTFKPTELKNYPVQGTGGEIVQMIVGRLWRYFMKKNNWDGKAFLVNTVHDCVWVDAHKDVRDEVARAMKAIMESVPQLLEREFNIKCPVPFPVDVEAGPNMLEMHHV